MSTVQGRVYENLCVILNSIFKYVFANSLISNNFMLLISFKKAERNNRRALTNEELKKMILRLSLPQFKAYRQTFLILLFFGLQPCELEDARFEGDFLIARNAKRKGGKIEYKKISVCNQARELLDLSVPIKSLHKTDVLNRIFKRIMDDGQITQRLVGRVYRHFSDEFMQEQMDKVIFDI